MEPCPGTKYKQIESNAKYSASGHLNLTTSIGKYKSLYNKKSDFNKTTIRQKNEHAYATFDVRYTY